MAATARATVDPAYLSRAPTRQIRVLTVDEHQLLEDTWQRTTVLGAVTIAVTRGVLRLRESI